MQRKVESAKKELLIYLRYHVVPVNKFNNVYFFL